MKYMMIVKHPETSSRPPQALIDAINRAAQEAVQSGSMLGNGGLAPTALGARVVLSGGKIKVVDGPFTEAKEIIGGYAQFEMSSKEDAVKAAVDFMELHKKYWPGWEGETEVRQMMDAMDCK